jgi:hypothetical protein
VNIFALIDLALRILDVVAGVIGGKAGGDMSLVAGEIQAATARLRAVIGQPVLKAQLEAMRFLPPWPDVVK